ncbi:MAG: TRAP transporter substrate-binding protein [Xanthobacteraceae bacterium]|nr:TRAP transporter substrate-binding protein [Xanthobacteraceae bacterium]PWB63413.1 MAG: ABC transporter substrate-binding protein [Bradyrhizobiaceae bacterium]
MNRRDIVKAAALAAGAGLVAAPAVAQSAPQIRWRLQSSYPTSLDTLHGACVYLAKAVAEATDGRFQIDVFAAGAIAPPLGVADAVQTGVVEMGYTGSYFYIGKDPAFVFGIGMPFGLNSRQQSAWFYHGGGLDLLNAFYARFNLHNLPGGNTGTQMAGWFRKEIKSVADLSGLKMRIGGLAGRILQKFGLVPQQLGAADTYSALERGTIDAAEWVGPYDDEKIGFQRIARYYYYPGFWEGNSALSFFVNLDKWRELPARYQSILATAAMAAAQDMQAKYDAQNPQALRRLVAAGAQLRPLPTEIFLEAFRAAEALYAEIAAQNPGFKTILDHVTTFRRDGYQWLQASDFTYDAMMIQALRQRG